MPAQPAGTQSSCPTGWEANQHIEPETGRMVTTCLWYSDIELDFWNAQVSQPLKRKTKIAAEEILLFYFHLSKKKRLDFSCESSA